MSQFNLAMSPTRLSRYILWLALSLLVQLAWATSASASIALVQKNFLSQSSASTASVNFSSAQGAGDLNVVVIGWIGSASNAPSSVSDSENNTYTLAVGPTRYGGLAEAIYYAANIKAASAGSNSVTVTMNGSVSYLDVQTTEYSGIVTSNPLDGAIGSGGTALAMSSGSVTTSNANDLLIGDVYLNGGVTSVGSGYTLRQTTNFGSILEDEVVSATGNYAATATQGSAGNWIMQVAAFKAATISAPTNLSATATSSVQINLTWSASTGGSGGVAGYRVERCTGSGCTNFVQIGTPTGTSYSDTPLAPLTTYSYRVRAVDGAGNLGAYSSTASATTPADPPPTAPTGLTASTVSGTQINLSWTASTDQVGVTGYRVERCTGSGCSSFAQIGTPTGTTYSDSGLSASTSYSYRVRATDAAGNLSAYSAIASATTGGGGIADIQANYSSQTSATGATVTFSNAQSAGDLNVVLIGWIDSGSNSPTSVTDSKGNTYRLAVGPTRYSGGGSQSIYYASGIVAASGGSNSVSVTMNGLVSFLDVRVTEYRGISTVSPLDGAVGASGTTLSLSSGSLSTLNANDLLVGGVYLVGGITAAGSGYTLRQTTTYGSILEDRGVTTAGTYAATATQGSATWWVTQLAAFKASTTTSGAIKWHPGHYMADYTYTLLGDPTLSEKQTEVNVLRSGPAAVLGWMGWYQWRTLENSGPGNPTTGVGYDFSTIDLDYVQLTTGCGPGLSCSWTTGSAFPGYNSPRRMIIKIEYFDEFFPNAPTTRMLPDYIANSSTYGPVGPNGTDYGYWNAQSSTGGTTAAYWRPAVLARLLALYQALANHVLPDGTTVDTSPYVEVIESMEETVTQASPPSGTGSDSTATQSNYDAALAAIAEQQATSRIPPSSFRTTSILPSMAMQSIPSIMSRHSQRIVMLPEGPIPSAQLILPIQAHAVDRRSMLV
jgi:hypothetical protein